MSDKFLDRIDEYSSYSTISNSHCDNRFGLTFFHFKLNLMENIIVDSARLGLQLKRVIRNRLDIRYLQYL